MTFNNNENGGQTSCRICLEDYENNDQLRRLGCMHLFHKDCIDPWLLSNNH